MTREEKDARRQEIKSLYSQGASVEELSAKFGLTKNYIYQFVDVKKRSGESMNSILIRNEQRVIELRLEGIQTKEIASMFGVSNDAVRTFLYSRNIKINEPRNSEEEAARRISEKTGELLEYVSGYTIKENPVRVRCTVCGFEFERTYHNITTKGFATCPCCLEQQRAQRDKARAAERERKRLERIAKSEEREAETNRKHKARLHSCPVCGKQTTNPKFCSKDCRVKANNANKEIKRRAKIKAALKDKDISVRGLYKRDKGVCYLCGGRCDLSDYIIKRGAFIAGDSYPSIDHVIPLAKGGAHAWNNVKLAHRRCNYLKGDKKIETISPLGAI